MNIDHEFESRRQLDHLVDGELSGDEYRELLTRLEEEPEGWRECALAFLEAQAWGQEFGAWREDEISGRKQVSRHIMEHSSANWSTRRLVGLTLAMAVSFVAAFASGVWWHRGEFAKPDALTPMVVRQSNNSRPLALEEDHPQRTKDESASDSLPTEHLTFVVDRGDGETEQFELPVYEANASVAQQLLGNSPSMPAEVERAIRDAGYRVNSQRHWAPVMLRDGRRAFFPVDQLDITPVSGTIYH